MEGKKAPQKTPSSASYPPRFPIHPTAAVAGQTCPPNTMSHPSMNMNSMLPPPYRQQPFSPSMLAARAIEQQHIQFQQNAMRQMQLHRANFRGSNIPHLARQPQHQQRFQPPPPSHPLARAQYPTPILVPPSGGAAIPVVKMETKKSPPIPRSSDDDDDDDDDATTAANPGTPFSHTPMRVAQGILKPKSKPPIIPPMSQRKAQHAGPFWQAQYSEVAGVEDSSSSSSWQQQRTAVSGAASRTQEQPMILSPMQALSRNLHAKKKLLAPKSAKGGKRNARVAVNVTPHASVPVTKEAIKKLANFIEARKDKEVRKGRKRKIISSAAGGGGGKSRSKGKSYEVCDDSPYNSGNLSVDEIEKLIPEHASCVFHILDRRVNLDNFEKDCSQYELLRAWIQDDPFRYVPPRGCDLMTHVGSEKKSAVEEAEEGVGRIEVHSFKKPKSVDLLSKLKRGGEPPSIMDISAESLIRGNLRRVKRSEVYREKTKLAAEKLREMGINIKNY